MRAWKARASSSLRATASATTAWVSSSTVHEASSGADEVRGTHASGPAAHTCSAADSVSWTASSTASKPSGARQHDAAAGVAIRRSS